MAYTERQKVFDLPEYRWPTNASVTRQYIVQDDQGRYGVATYDPVYKPDVLFAHPIDVDAEISAKGIKGAEGLPSGAILMTDTPFHRRDDGAIRGTWYDYGKVGGIPAADLRTLTIVSDLGWTMPDAQAALLLAGSEDMGHWDAFWKSESARRAGSATSDAKAAASRENGKRGGRPKGSGKKAPSDE